MLYTNTLKEIADNNLSDIIFYSRCAFENSCETFNEVKRYLNNKKIKYTEEELRLSINYLVSEFGVITRTDYYYGNPTYEIMDERREDSTYTTHFRKFIDDNPNKEKRILLISDTHIGNDELQNMELLRNIYEYAELNDCDYVFHEGDLFDGINGEYDKEKLDEQIEIFKKDYPRSKIKTIAVSGNHDEWFSGKRRFLFDEAWQIFPREFCLKSLNRMNSNFNMYEIGSFSTNLNHHSFHIGHKLYINGIISDKKINNIEEIGEEEHWMDDYYKVLISGHLHKGMIYSTDDIPLSPGIQVIFLGVPSLSNINRNGVCAYIISLKKNDMNISVLSNFNGKIEEKDNIVWTFNNNNKVLRKSYNW